MKFLRFKYQSDAALGVVTDHGTVLNLTALLTGAPTNIPEFVALSGDNLHEVRDLLDNDQGRDNEVPIDAIQWLPPVVPQKNVFCVGRNYRDHIIEGNIAKGVDPYTFPEAIEFFSKPPTAIVAHGSDVLRHALLTDSLDYEVELAIVMGRRGRDIPAEQALDYVFGFTIVNDVTARDLQRRHGQWFKGKGLDTSCPIGPVVVHRSAISDANALNLEMLVNGEVRQSDNTRDMLFRVEDVISQLSAGLTLEPGDVIATGTPKGVGFAMKPPRCLNSGDIMRARIEGIGELTNTVVD